MEIPSDVPHAIIFACQLTGIVPTFAQYETFDWRVPTASASFCCVPNFAMIDSAVFMPAQYQIIWYCQQVF
jgi:hypothetical protein